MYAGSYRCEVGSSPRRVFAPRQEKGGQRRIGKSVRLQRGLSLVRTNRTRQDLKAPRNMQDVVKRARLDSNQ